MPSKHQNWRIVLRAGPCRPLGAKAFVAQREGLRVGMQRPSCGDVRFFGRLWANLPVALNLSLYQMGRVRPCGACARVVDCGCRAAGRAMRSSGLMLRRAGRLAAHAVVRRWGGGAWAWTAWACGNAKSASDAVAWMRFSVAFVGLWHRRDAGSVVGAWGLTSRKPSCR